MFSRKKKEKNSPSTIAMMDKRVKETYVEDEIAKIKEEDLEEVLDQEEKITGKIHKIRPIRRFATATKVMFEMLWDYRIGRYTKTPWLTIATIVMILLYVLNPFDLVPDFIPVVGYLDDLAVLTIGIGWIETDLHQYLDWRLDQEK